MTFAQERIEQMERACKWQAERIRELKKEVEHREGMISHYATLADKLAKELANKKEGAIGK